EVFLDYQSIGQHNGVLDLILVAVKKSKVLEYAAVVEEAGLVPSIVDVDSFALGNQFELNYPSDRGETVALIDIGASIMKTNVVRGGSTIFARDIPFGGNNYTQAIAQQLKSPFEQAEAAKLGRCGGPGTKRSDQDQPRARSGPPAQGRIQGDQAQLAGVQSRRALRRGLSRPAGLHRPVLVVPDEHQGEPHRRHRSGEPGSRHAEGADRSGEQGPRSGQRAPQARRRDRSDHQGAGAEDPARRSVRERYSERSL